MMMKEKNSAMNVTSKVKVSQEERKKYIYIMNERKKERKKEKNEKYEKEKKYEYA
jgi:hypothetical protein